jgi:hypothetical protein
LVVAVAFLAHAVSCRSFEVTEATTAGAAAGGYAGNATAGNAGGGSKDLLGGTAGDGGASGTSDGASDGGVAGDGGVVGIGADAGAGGVAGAGGEPSIGRILESPVELADLSLWLEASSEVGVESDNRVVVWGDSSVHGNDAKQIDSLHRALLKPDAVNAHPAVAFDGMPSNLFIDNSSALEFGGEPFTVAFVGEWTNSDMPVYVQEGGVVKSVSYSGYGDILTKVGLAPTYTGLALFANSPGPFATAPTARRFSAQLQLATATLASTATNLNDGNYRLYVAQRNEPSELELRINGSAQGRSDIPISVDATSGSSLRLGGSTTTPFRGAIAELVIVKGALSSDDLHALESYMVSKYAL